MSKILAIVIIQNKNVVKVPTYTTFLSNYLNKSTYIYLQKTMSLKNVKAFYERLASDKEFSNLIQNVNSKEECSQIVKSAGFDFTLEEYEDYTAQLLEASEGEGKLKDLSEKELAGVFGGLTGYRKIQPLYGVIWKEPPAQAMYGVVIGDY